MGYKTIIAGVFLAFGLLELALGRYLHREQTTPKDVLMEVASFLFMPLLIVPFIFTLSPLLAEALVPQSQGMWSHWPWWLMFLAFLLADDLTQYWWHRLSHSVPFLYGLHRAHHSAAYMSVRIVYRNNLIYYALMPGLWFSAALVYWGLGPVYVVYIILKMTVIIGAHSSVPWDQALYEWRWSRPAMWLIERVISTPSTHSAHHGLHADDGVTHYHGNYGNLLFFWDVLFGTAKITRRRPEAYGIENMEPVGLFEELIWPFKVPRETSPEEQEALGRVESEG